MPNVQQYLDVKSRFRRKAVLWENFMQSSDIGPVQAGRPGFGFLLRQNSILPPWLIGCDCGKLPHFCVQIRNLYKVWGLQGFLSLSNFRVSSVYFQLVSGANKLK